MGEWFAQVAGSGSMVLAVPIAVLAGLVSFFSPCVIPLLPGYLSYATGLSGADLADTSETGPHRGRMLAGSLLFVAGFTVVFVLLGVASASVSRWFFVNQTALNIFLGVLAIGHGLAFMGALPVLQRDFRIHRVPAVGLAAAPLLGFLFGLGWTPCIGPTLSVILFLAYGEDTLRGGVLMAFYSLGLGLPFILAGLAWRRALGTVAFVRRHQLWVTRLGGGMLVAVGVLLLTGWWTEAVQWLQYHVVNDYQVGV
ncbi:MAG TPA: cytochrome c biogenesis protein CcdA [Nocardioides sp.]|uniref:cytochrome c biogenesis CcdA family protein n=1 Tax=uncultured Nocardioides sp. TaxID=198441 RepID=UPI000EC105C8|nr:cytochrome c biogenesis protein CcdA [uncultured Nocardioides sp.]HCB03412.1 cytochrome C biogenesis protein ResC [Nocardioides sp.]HRD60967.1 cytochrome c biogenesis protein CcdA [Nocardioides sp.]HRI94962.1 cytochrome c biogenesis protein CcdA [Nocardioides sp.]HRK45530.1 cytochrome c biogenesis protein CcdA [Nocardioides sp.]